MPKTLPQRPNLVQLKHQARDLQRAYAAGDLAARHCVARHVPTARLRENRLLLSQAFLVLAREYSFASWPQLRRHVEQIRANAPVMTPRQAQIAAMAERIATAAEQHDRAALFAALQIGRHDTDTVRALLVTQERFRSVVDVLLSGVAHADARIRFLTAQAFDHWADERCAAPLWVLLHDSVPRVRWAALHSLQCAECKLSPLAQGPDLVAMITAMAQGDPSIKVRRVATWELGRLCPDPRAISVLQHLALHEDDPVIVRNAQISLRRTNHTVDGSLRAGEHTDATRTG